ncbi:MAG: hypothetical protein LH679_19860 [Cyanobacteria bacterium CAN_BIN43]|nr:hypothetical protein [Cyanobacteria bacterium CAN_BIN43]
MLLRSLFYLLLAGFCEISGDDLLWLRDGKSPWLGLLGGIILVFLRIYSHLASS